MIECPDRYIIDSIKDLGSDPVTIAQMLPEVNMRRILENMRDPFEEQEEESTKSPERSERQMKMAERVQQGFRDKANIAEFRKNMRSPAAAGNGRVEIEANMGDGSSYSGMVYQV